eukprot:NODE_742_length_4662_cov_0.166557.p1 type:complete len:392 gc:universal NODE_742_length_4662_cov_0.166557:704-1879(+)
MEMGTFVKISWYTIHSDCYSLKNIILSLAHTPRLILQKMSQMLIIKTLQLILFILLNLVIVPFDQSKDGLLVWDAIHYKHILNRGYEYEHSLAFMPGIILFVNILHTILWFFPKILVGIVFVNILHVLAAYYLNKIGRILGIMHAWPLIIFTPQVMMLSTLYTEFPFAGFTFIGVFYCHQDQILKSILSFTIASSFRSNGLVNTGFLIWWGLRRYFLNSLTLTNLVQITLGSLAIATPFVVFQYYAYLMYCPSRPWCDDLLSYAFVQREYWNSGWFLYFTANNIPLFFLVLPLQVILIRYIPFVAKECYESYRITDLLVNPLTPHIVQLVFYLIYGTFAMHVNTLLRLLSGCPGFYFVMSKAIQESNTVLYIFGIYFGITAVTNISFLPPA